MQTKAQARVFWRTPAVSMTGLLMPLMFFVFFVLSYAREPWQGSISVGAYMLATSARPAIIHILAGEGELTVDRCGSRKLTPGNQHRTPFRRSRSGLPSMCNRTGRHVVDCPANSTAEVRSVEDAQPGPVRLAPHDLRPRSGLVERRRRGESEVAAVQGGQRLLQPEVGFGS